MLQIPLRFELFSQNNAIMCFQIIFLMYYLFVHNVLFKYWLPVNYSHQIYALQTLAGRRNFETVTHEINFE